MWNKQASLLSAPEADPSVSGPLKPEHSEAQAPLPWAGPSTSESSAGPALPRGPHASGGFEEFSSFHAVKGTWQADDNIASRRNTQRQCLSSGSLEDPEHRPCVWGPLAV
ncbi:hypothetical protein MUG91_G100n25 [Manis pentadactyla]|nr:hypothetical protein MUG91_G100n25 [Manis pentadactyla]